VSRDPYLLTIPETARLLGKDRNTLSRALDEMGDVWARYPGSYKRVNLIRLCRAVFGEDYERVLPEWRERVAEMRAS
jgi:hypothetical protein